MNEFENTLTDVQEPVVEVQETNALENDAQGVVVEPQEPSGAETDMQGENEGTAEPAEPLEQSRLDNSLAKAARLKAERETAERLQREYDAQIASAGILNPYTGQPIKSHDEFLAYAEAMRKEQLQVQAEQLGVDPAALEAEYQEKLKTSQKIADLEAEKAIYEAQLEQAEQERIERKLNDDLTELQGKHPELKDVKHITELGNDFIGMLAAGVSLDAAYEAYKIVKERNTKPVPPSMGAVNSSEEREKDFYTPAEVDKLTPSDFKRNPKLLEKVQNSMKLWK